MVLVRATVGLGTTSQIVFRWEWSLLCWQLCHVIICFSVRGNSYSFKKVLVLAPLWGPLSLQFSWALLVVPWFSQLIKHMDLPFIGIRESAFLGLCLRVTGLCCIIIIKKQVLRNKLCSYLKIYMVIWYLLRAMAKKTGPLENWWKLWALSLEKYTQVHILWVWCITVPNKQISGAVACG